MRDGDNNIFSMTWQKVKEFATTNKKQFIRGLIICFVIGFLVTMFIIQSITSVMDLIRGIDRGIIITNLFISYFKYILISFPFTLMVALILFWVYVTFKRVTKFKGKYDSERNITILEQGDGGTGKLLQEDDADFREVFNVGHFGDYDSNIFGCLDGEYDGNSSIETKHGEVIVYEMDKTIQDNMNLLCVAKAGGGKTRKKALNDILQCLNRGDSVVCTDTKGDLVRLLYRYAHDYLGITTKIINFKPDELRYSDAIDIFAEIGDYSEIKKIEDSTARETAIMVAKSKCDDIAECIRKNLNNQVDTKKEDFWDMEGRNYIRFWVSYFFFNEEIPKEKKNFYEIAQKLSVLAIKEKEGQPLPEGKEGFVDDLIKEIQSSKILTETCLYNLQTMLAGTSTVKNSVHGGLLTTLSPVVNPLMREITSHNEVDLSLPAKEQCMYFLVMDAIDKNNQFLIATTLTLMYQGMLKYIDSKVDNHMANQPVWMIYDEFTNIGYVPNMATYLAVVRDQCIRHELFIQALALAKNVYTEEEIIAIRTNCEYWELLGTTEEEVLELFNVASGKMSILGESERKQFSKLKLINLPLSVQQTSQVTERDVLLLDEISRMKKYELLVYKQGNFMAKLHTWDYTNHPSWKECKPYATSLHVPLWAMKKAIANQDKEKRDKEMFDE